jgi:hypothetical protein
MKTLPMISNVAREYILFRDVKHYGTSSAPGINSLQFRNSWNCFQFRNSVPELLVALTLTHTVVIED